MLNYKLGNLIKAAADGEVDVIIHQANCFNTMKSGFAKALVEYIPEVAEVDKLTLSGDKYKLGSYTIVTKGHGASELDVINMYSQYSCGTDKQYTDYDAIYSCLLLLKANEEIDKYTHIGMPKIGAGLGGGDWSIISKIIEGVLKDYNVTIYVLDEKEIPCQ